MQIIEGVNIVQPMEELVRVAKAHQSGDGEDRRDRLFKAFAMEVGGRYPRPGIRFPLETR